MGRSVSKKHAEFGKDYSEWKEWNSDRFGALTTPMRAYYSAEMQRCGFKDMQHLHVLEIGFGNGGFLAFCRTKAWEAQGVEVNEALVDAATVRGFNAQLAHSLDGFDPNKFDLVVAFDVLEHIEQDDLVKTWKEIKRVLKPGGVFLARFPNGDSPFGLVNQNGDLTHVNSIGSGKVSQLASLVSGTVMFVGGAAEPLFTGKVFSTIHAVLTVPLKWALNLVLTNIFFPRRSVALCYSNLVSIVRFPKNPA